MSSDEAICDLLDEAGLIHMPYPDFIDVEAYDQTRSAAKPPIPNDDLSQIVRGTESDSFRRDDRAPSPEASIPSVGSGSEVVSPNSSFSSPPREFKPFTINSGPAEYWQLLDNIIAVAKSNSGRLPTRGVYNFDDLRSALPRESEPGQDIYHYPYHSPFGFRSPEQREHNLKMGAAGELYVFEILSKLKLPGFSCSNWQSRIRQYVNIHENYRYLKAWRGQDVDMIYDDNDGLFTELLVENGHLDKIWMEAKAKPKYWLEVKTTTRQCGARFFLTKPEYQRMELMKLTKGQVSSHVYIILRVFDLDKETIGLRLYVDPKGMEERRELRITSESPELYSALDLGTI